MFMEKSLEKLRSVAADPVDVTIWTSSLTTEKYIDDLSKDDYTIQGPFIFLFFRGKTNDNKFFFSSGIKITSSSPKKTQIGK